MLLEILILLAIFIFFRLFREFGRSREIIIKMNPEDKEKLKSAIENLVSVNLQDQEHQDQQINNKTGNTNLDELSQLRVHFPDFSTSVFLNKADEMFDAIFNAFANSHHHTLKSMLTDALYEQFASQIQKREERNLRQEILIKHRETTLDKIQLLAEKARLLVKFNVSQMSAMVSSEGTSYDNPKRIYRDVTHKWIFERTFNKDSNWILSQTSSSES